MQAGTVNKMDNKKGISFIGLLQVAFIVLKLVGAINWKWSVVLIPLWVELGLIAMVIILCIIENHIGG